MIIIIIIINVVKLLKYFLLKLMLIHNSIARIILISVINMNAIITCISIAIVYFFPMPLLALFLLVSLNVTTAIACIIIAMAHKHNV